VPQTFDFKASVEHALKSAKAMGCELEAVVGSTSAKGKVIIMSAQRDYLLCRDVGDDNGQRWMYLYTQIIGIGLPAAFLPPGI
jgi:hypothetical protein